MQEPNFTFGQKAAIFTPTFLASEGLLALLHAPLPLEVGALVGAFLLAKKSPELVPWLAPYLGKREPGRGGSAESWTLMDRLMGRHLRSEGAIYESEASEGLADLEWDQDVETKELPQPPSRPTEFLFSDVLKTFQPSKDRIFLARTQDGKDLYCAAKDLCHVAIAGNTGSGKSATQRLLMLQLCRARMNVLWLNPHYTRFDLESGEDWTPFDPYLLHPPMECRKYEVIEHYLKHMAHALVPKRLERRAQSLPLGKPYFVFMDELPAIIRQIPDAPKYMRVILEEGRKVGVFLVVASHDFLVKTINPDGGGGSIRECYRTAYYGGGDATTGRTILDMPARLIPEAQLGKGIVMFRGAPQKEAAQCLVPYVDNASLYRLLGPSTYQAVLPDEEGVELSPETVMSRHGSREQLLDTIVQLANTDQLDEEAIIGLIEQLPQVRDVNGDGSTRSVAKPLSQLEMAVNAYEEGADTLVKLATALSISEWKARGLMVQVQEELKVRAKRC